MNQKYVISDAGSVKNFSPEEIKWGLGQAIEHYAHIEEHWRNYAKEVGYKHLLDCSRMINFLESGSSSKNWRNWDADVAQLAAHFASPMKFGDKSSYKLHDTSIRTIIDMLQASNNCRSSIVLIKPPQSGATTTISAYGMFMRTIRNIEIDADDAMRWIEAYPNDTTIEGQAKQARELLSPLYGKVTIGEKPLGRTCQKLNELHERTRSGEVHKMNYRFAGNFISTVADGLMSHVIKNGIVEEEMLLECIAESIKNSPLTIAVDECQRGSAHNQVLGKHLITTMRAVNKYASKGELSFLLASATPFEVVNTDPDEDVKRVPVWVGENYSGPLVFEGIKINVLGDRNKVSPPKLFTFGNAFDLKDKFGYKSVDFTISNKYGRAKESKRFEKFVKNEFDSTVSKLRKENHPFYKKSWSLFQQYDEYLDKVVSHCIHAAFEMQEGEEYRGVAIRLPSKNDSANELIESWSLPEDVKVIKCYGDNDIVEDVDGKKKKCNPAQLAHQAMREGFKRFVIVHTGGGRMGSQFPVECRYFMETISDTKQTDPLIQAYYGRGCGHNKCSVYIANVTNIEHLEYFHAHGESPKKRPSIRSSRQSRTHDDIYGWLLKKTIEKSGNKTLDRFLEVVDEEIRRHVWYTLNDKYNQSPELFFKKRHENPNVHHIQTNDRVSNTIIQAMNEVWPLLETHPHLTTDKFGCPYVDVKAVRTEGDIKSQNEIIAKWHQKEALPSGYVSKDNKVADSTVGLRVWKGALKDPATIDVGGGHQAKKWNSGNTAVKTNPRTKAIQYQVVWDFDDAGAARFVGIKYMFVERMRKQDQVFANDNSCFHKMNDISVTSSGSNELVYELKSKKIFARLVVNGIKTIQAGSYMTGDKQLNKNCPKSAIELREDLKNTKCLRFIPRYKMWRFNEDVDVEEDVSLFQIGSALYGANRTSANAWRVIDV